MMPKIELHVHLDGSMRLLTASELSGKSLESVKKEMVATEQCRDLNDYLTKFDLPISLLQTKENLTRVASELAMDLEDDGVMYAEVRFAPIFHTKSGLTLEEIVEAVLLGLKEAHIQIGLLLCLMRNASDEENSQVISVAKKYLGKGVVGIDLAGAEAIYPTRDFSFLFQEASRLKIPFTIHAGEAAGPDSIQDALMMGAVRIGHGVRIIEDDDLLTEIVEKKIPLEICPTSNIQTGIFPSYSKHNIDTLYQKKVPVTINTDNRTVSNITLTKEYQKLTESFSFTLEDFKMINLNAIQSSFLSIEEKQKLEQDYLLKWEQYVRSR